MAADKAPTQPAALTTLWRVGPPEPPPWRWDSPAVLTGAGCRLTTQPPHEPPGTCGGRGQRRDGVPRLVQVVSGGVLSPGNHRLDLLLDNPSDDAQLPPKPKFRAKVTATRFVQNLHREPLGSQLCLQQTRHSQGPWLPPRCTLSSARAGPDPGGQVVSLSQQTTLGAKQRAPWRLPAPTRPCPETQFSGPPGIKGFQGLVPGLLLQAAHGRVAGHRHGHCTQHQRGDGLHGQDVDLRPLCVFLEGGEPQVTTACAGSTLPPPWLPGQALAGMGPEQDKRTLPSRPGSQCICLNSPESTRTCDLR